MYFVIKPITQFMKNSTCSWFCWSGSHMLLSRFPIRHVPLHPYCAINWVKSGGNTICPMQIPAKAKELANVNLSLKYTPTTMIDGAYKKPSPTPVKDYISIVQWGIFHERSCDSLDLIKSRSTRFSHTNRPD